MSTTSDPVLVAHLCISRIHNSRIFIDLSLTAYIFSSENVFYAVNLKDCKCVRTFIAPSPVISIFRIGSLVYGLCKNGNIYSISKTVDDSCFKNDKLNESSDVFMDASFEEGNCIIAPIKLSYPIFQNKIAKVVSCTGDYVCILSRNEVQWSVNVYKATLSLSNTHDLTLLSTTHLPCKNKMVSHPLMTTYLLGSNSSDDVLDSNLFNQLCKEQSTSSVKLMALVSIADGDVWCVSVSEDSHHQNSAVPLFCLHQPLKTLQKISLQQGPTSRKEALLCVGILGKVVVLCKSQDATQQDFPLIVELYIPGPVHSWSGHNEFSYHSDGTSLWHSIFSFNNDIPVVNTVNANVGRAIAVQIYVEKDGTRGMIYYCEEGRLFHLTKLENICASSLVSKPCLPPEPGDLNELLTAIHQCSEVLSRTVKIYSDKRKYLQELSCAAHVMLIEKVKKSLDVSISTSWTLSDPDYVTITSKITNNADFPIVGDHWHFINTITSASGIYEIKSVFLSEGLKIGQSVETFMKLNLCNIISDDHFPLVTFSGLQFFLNINQLTSEPLTFNLESYTPPVTFYINLKECLIDELFFLNVDQISTVLFHIEPPINTALWELAKMKNSSLLHEIEDVSRYRRTTLDPVVTFTIKVTCWYIQNLIGSHFSSSNGPLTPSQLLEFIVESSRPYVKDNCTDSLEVFLFGKKIKFVVLQEEIYMIIKVDCWYPLLLPKIKRAILRKLQLIGCNNNPIAKRKREKPEEFVVSQSVLNKALNLKTRINQVYLFRPEDSGRLVPHIYDEMRKSVSSELPFS